MNRHPAVRAALAAALLLPLAGPVTAWAYDSGSTGADGALEVTIDTTLPLPPDGVFNYTDVNVAAGATLRFTPNATNTPVTILASGNINIAGTVDVSGEWAPPAGAAGDGNIGDDGLPGTPGPGGFAGGIGGKNTNTGSRVGGNGIGPGGGGGGVIVDPSTNGGGKGGGYGTSGGAHSYWRNNSQPGQPYGSETLLPLVGGSGGGGGCGGTTFLGAGGGGGGGAILIASSGTASITGTIQAIGGGGGGASGTGAGGGGGGGSGGAIRVVATTFSGNGDINAGGGSRGDGLNLDISGTSGGYGRIRLEAETFQRTANTTPQYTFGTPAPAFVAGLPALRISSVGGIVAPATPTGNADIVLPADTVNPILVEVSTTGVPVGNTVKITVIPATGAVAASTLTPALTGTIDAATASVAVDLPTGPSTLMAETTYTIVAALGDTLAPLAGGERVERVRLAAAMNGPGTITLITVSGREYTHPAGKVPLMPAG